MVRMRPTVILVMAILSIIFGSIWVLLGLCTAAQPFLLYNFPLRQPGGQTTYPYRELYEVLQREVPAYRAVEITHIAMGLALAILLIVSGVGLLRMRNWARWTAIFYGAATVLSVLAYSVFSWIYVQPISESWTREFLSKQPVGTASFIGSPGVAAVIAIGSLTFSLAFPVVLLIFMFLPGVRAAFAGRDGSSIKGSGGPEGRG